MVRVYLTNPNSPAVPRFYCRNCQNLKDGNYCTCFKRPIQKKRQTKCFYHTKHTSIHREYKAPENLKELAYENYLREIS